MAEVKISELSPAGALAGTEELPVVQSGATVKATAQAVANLFVISSPTVVTTTISYAVLATDSTVLANGTLTLTLPTVGISAGKTYRLKNIGTGIVTVACSVNIDNATSFVMNGIYDSIDVQWNGTQYWIL